MQKTTTDCKTTSPANSQGQPQVSFESILLNAHTMTTGISQFIRDTGTIVNSLNETIQKLQEEIASEAEKNKEISASQLAEIIELKGQIKILTKEETSKE